MTPGLTPDWGKETLFDIKLFGIDLGAFTYNEMHAVALGVIGFWLGRHEQPLMAAWLSIGAYAYPVDKHDSIGLRTTSSESWYFVVSLFFWYLAGEITIQ